MASLCARVAFSTKLIKSPSVIRNVLTNGERHINRSTLPSLLHSNRKFCSAKPLPKKETVTVHFIKGDGKKMTTKAAIGENLLDIIVENDIDIDGFGACEGTLACSTCHLIFKQEDYNKLGEQPTDEELDMLDLAFSLSDTSRLGCQVIVTKEMDGWEISVPEGVADARTP